MKGGFAGARLVIRLLVSSKMEALLPFAIELGPSHL